MSEPFGAWQLEGLIAVGGLGEVWRATHGGTVAALKRLHTHLVRNDEARAQFSVEQQLAQTLPRHPNVVHAIEIGEVAERPYVALELAPGEDLRRIVMPPRPEPGSTAPRATVQLPRVRVLAIAIAACDAASHLHESGWVHGDINPSNLIVDTDDRLTLVDLGVARTIGAGGSVRGTHAYMAPEQIRGEAWTPATDVFALGVVLWELVSGERLFHRGPPWLSMAAVMETAPPPLADPMLDGIVQAALAKEPARRMQSAIAMAQRLRDL
jgi:serine/threonine protein kinase